jgi:hypothetical protein
VAEAEKARGEGFMAAAHSHKQLLSLQQLLEVCS